MGVLPHVKKLDDALGHFLVQIMSSASFSDGAPIALFDGTPSSRSHAL
jgi:hypothetical protein